MTKVQPFTTHSVKEMNAQLCKQHDYVHNDRPICWQRSRLNLERKFTMVAVTFVDLCQN